MRIHVNEEVSSEDSIKETDSEDEERFRFFESKARKELRKELKAEKARRRHLSKGQKEIME
jgi:hypothetical protein